MRSIFVIFAGFAAAIPTGTIVVPPPPAAAVDVRLLNISAIGTGCPAGHSVVNIDATGTIFDVAFDQYVVTVGPGAATSDARKNCRMSMNLQFSSGYQFSIIETRFQGYASLASDQTGIVRAGYTFSGDSSQESVFSKSIQPPYDDNYNMIAGVGIESYSKCGGSTAILNVNSEIRITPLTSPNKGAMTVDSFDGEVHVIFKTNWRKC